MSSFYHGEVLELSIFGQSHSPAIGMSLSVFPPASRLTWTSFPHFFAGAPPGRTPGPRRERRQTPRSFSQVSSET